MADPLTPGSVAEAYEKTAATPGAKFDGASPAKRRGCAPLTVAHSLIGAGALVAVIAVAYGAALPSVITTKIEDGVATCKTSDIQKEAFLDQYGDCSDCTPYYYNLNMFNVTNAMDYLENGAKLKLQEVGPYAYRRRQIKVDVALSDDSSEISYKMYTYHTFEKELSCATCSDTDEVISMDVGYLNVIAQAGGELGFVRRLAAGTIWGKALNESDREVIVQANKAQMMRWANGLNSNQPTAWKQLSSTVMGFLAAGVDSIADVKMEGFEYNGVFAKRPISDWALGFPSLLAGLGLGTNYINVCKPDGGMNDKCAKCTAATCPDIWSECKKCTTGAKVLAVNQLACGKIVKKYTDVYGLDKASDVNSTCNLCDSVGVCAAPMPGAVEGSGLDYSKTPPNSASLNTYIQKTGCHGKFDEINDYVQFDGYKTQPLWVTLDSRRNPTLAELNAFAVYGNCDAKPANVTCAPVIGPDGTSTPPGGATIMGFPDKIDLQSARMYLNQAKQNITLVNTGKTYDLDGASLTRFVPPSDLLKYDEAKARQGTAFPVDGVQPLGFNVGFLAYVSYPLFLWGDKSLLEAVDVTMYNGKAATEANLYGSDGNLLGEIADRYQTTVDYEAGTGKAMRARKRLQASYALAKSQFTKDTVMSDVLWPKVTPEVIMPAYFGEESATITSSRLSSYKTIKAILTSLLPVLIVGAVLGLAMVAFGFIKRRRALAAHKGPISEVV